MLLERQAKTVVPAMRLRDGPPEREAHIKGKYPVM
jgi:hypothetical protein